MAEESPEHEIDIAAMSQLVDAARDGDSAAHSEICRQVYDRLNRLANQHLDDKLRRKLNPSDIVQATLTRMVQGFDDFRDSSSAEFYGWLNSILKNEVNSTRRDYQRHRRDIRREWEPKSATPGQNVGPTNHALPEQNLIHNEKVAQFHTALKRLSPDYAQVIELRSISELPFEEVAKTMNRSVNAVTKLWGRALVGLQQELEKLDDSFTI